MISRTRLKELAAYKIVKHCDEEHLFVVEGDKMCGEALHSNFDIVAICATPSWIARHQGEMQGNDCYEVGDADLERLSSMRQPNQVWMLLHRPDYHLLPAVDDEQGLLLVLDHIQDPGNMGTIIRTADWYGIRHIMCSADSASCYNPKVVQATMGGIFRTRITYGDLPTLLANYKHPIYGALLGGDSLYDATLPLPAALAIGNESRGLSPEVQQMLTHSIAIPNRGGTCESLNASVATAILCDAFMRNSKQ